MAKKKTIEDFSTLVIDEDITNVLEQRKIQRQQIQPIQDPTLRQRAITGAKTAFKGIFERPGAAIRAGVRALPPGGETPIEAFKRGAVTPEDVPLFQEQAKEKTEELQQRLGKVGEIVGELPISGAIKVKQGLEVIGQTADILTNPAEIGLIIADILGGKKITKVIGKTGEKVTEIVQPRKTLVISKKKPFLQQSRKLDNAANEVQTGMGKEFSNMLDVFGDVEVPIPEVQEAIFNLPQNVTNAIKESPDIVFEAQGNIEPVVRNIHNMRRVIADFMTGDDFFKFTNLKQKRIKDAFIKLGNIIKDVDKKNIAPVYQRYSDWITLRKSIKDITRMKGKVVGAKLKRVVSGTGEELAQETLEKFAKLFPKANDILIETKRIASKIARIKGIKRVGLGLVRGATFLAGARILGSSINVGGGGENVPTEAR